MIYLITYNNLLTADSGPIHETISKHMGVSDWWHYLPNTYLVSSTENEQFLANKIITRHPGLLFLIIAVDPKKYNGVLNKKAWEWIRRKGNTIIRLKVAPQPPKSINEMLGLPPIMPSKPISTGNPYLDDILNSVKR